MSRKLSEAQRQSLEMLNRDPEYWVPSYHLSARNGKALERLGLAERKERSPAGRLLVFYRITAQGRALLEAGDAE